jgi:GR25 family glycosyltransferase involved in LPS biosynthesis
MQEIEKCYYINLEHRLDRKANIERQMQTLDLAKKTFRYKAVEGAFVNAEKFKGDLLSERGIDDLSSNACKVWGLSLTQGALGLILTHINIYNEIILNDKNFLIIEDDVRIAENVDSELKKVLLELPDNFDICYLGYCNTPFDKKPYSENLSIPFGQLSCTPALIISPSGAAKVKSFIKNIDHQIDTFLYSNFHRLNVFISNKKLFFNF